MSRTKGKAGEAESRRLFEAYGANVRPLQSGQADRDDAGDYLVTLGGSTFIVQCRRRERTRILEASREVEAIARAGELPAVVYRPSREPWRVSMRLEDFLAVAKGLQNERQPGTIPLP